MDSIFILWVFVLLLPIIITTALCIHCREAAPTRIPQSVDDYDYKPPGMMSPGSYPSFTVLRPSNYAQRSGPSGLPGTLPDHFLSIPSLLPAESRRSSFAKPEADNDSVPSYENEEPIQTDDDDIYLSGYIEVLPDNPSVSVNEAAPSGSLSSAVMEDYQNVPEQQRDSLGDSLEYVNVPDPKETAQFVDNYDDVRDRESDDDTPDYENVPKNSQG